MRFPLAVPAFAALAAALPAPQEIDLDMVIAQPDPTYTTTASAVTYDVASLAAQATSDVSSVSIDISDVATATPVAVAERNIAKRAACAPQPTGIASYAVTSPTDSASAFASNAAFASAASAAPVPSGYSSTFTNLNASNNAYGYLGYTTLSSYDSEKCASKCNAINGCMSFNLYFERDPSLEPGTGCENPSSVTMIKCVFWGGPVSSSNANNYGQYRSKFQVVIAGSNGYMNNTLAVPDGFTSAQYLGNAAINAPLDAQGYDTFMGSRIFTAGPFNASLCAAHCQAQNDYNTAHPPTDGSPVKICNFFNTYLLYLNTTANMQGQYCSLYTEAWGSSYATNKGQYRGYDQYKIEYSYSFTNASNAGVSPKVGDKNGAIHQASVDINYATLQPFCSSYLGYSALVATSTPLTTVTPVVTSVVLATTTVTAEDIQKRALSTPNVLTKYPTSVVSSACSMLVSQATSTSTSTAAAVTVQAATRTTLQTSVTTVTASPIPKTCGNKGIQFAYYGNDDYFNGNYVNYLDPSDYWGAPVTLNSTTTKVGGINVNSMDGAPIQLYDTGISVNSQYFILNHRGYIFAQVSGTYTFTIADPDDIVFLYLGDDARNNWSVSTAKAVASCCYSRYPTRATATYDLNAGDYLPFRIVFGQQGGPVRFSFQIAAPGNNVILDSNTKESDFVVQYSCDGTSAKPFDDWVRH